MIDPFQMSMPCRPVIFFIGLVVNAELIWAVGDIGLGLLAWINLACLALLFPLVSKIWRDYENQRSQGLDPVFDPKALNIHGADFWENNEAPTPAHDKRH